MVNRAYVDQYIEANANLTPLKLKKPIIKKWQSTELSEEKIRSHRGNLGWVLGERDLVIDIDPRNKGTASFEKLAAKLSGEGLLETVKTAGSGFHVYLTIPQKYAGRKLKKKLREYPGIDFLFAGAQCVIAGSKVEGRQYKWTNGGFHQSEAPDDLVELLLTEKLDVADAGEDLGDFEGLIGSGTATEERVLGLLDKIDHNILNDDWVRVGMALKNWDPARGLELWEEWSIGGDTYKEGEAEARWPSFRVDGNVTIGTLVHMARSTDFDEALDRRTVMVNRIMVSDEREITVSIYNDIRRAEMSDQDRELLAVTIQRRLHQITGVKPGIGLVRSEVRTTSVARTDQSPPEWCKSWAYILSHKCYAYLPTGRLLNAEAFNLENTHRSPMTEGGQRASATWYVAQSNFLEVLDGTQYLPMYDDRVLSFNGQRVMNSFIPSSIPDAADDIGGDAQAIIDRITAHIRLLIGKDSEIMLQWMAHNVQFPGRKILWAPVIQSRQGAGKSLMKYIILKCLAAPNVGVVLTTQVASTFNGWATNRAVNILEELKLAGHNRFDTANSLKPMITDSVIQINEKNIKPFLSHNVTNYMCFTNYKDALPIDEGDRRYWIVFSPLTKEDLPDQDYFYNLFEDLKSIGPELRRWMLDYPTDLIRAAVQAPESRSKRAMIMIEEEKVEGLSEIRDLIQEGGEGYDDELFFTGPLFQALKESTMFGDDPIDLGRSEKVALIKRLDFIPYHKKIKFKGGKVTAYTRDGMNLKQIRKYIEKMGW